MTHRLTIAFAAALLTVSPAPAQLEPGRELELGGGWFQDNPLNVDDIGVFPSGPSIDFAWTRWWNERHSIALGVTSLPERDSWDRRQQALGLYAHVTWRRRWAATDGRGSFHGVRVTLSGGRERQARVRSR